MNHHLIFAVVAILFPFTTANYGHTRYGGHGSYLPSGGSNGVEEVINAAAGNQHAAASLTAAADVGAPPSAQAGLAHANAQLEALNESPNYQNLKNSASIADSLALNNLGANIRQGNIQLVAPNVVGQTAFRSLLVPNGLNNHQVVATQPLQPIVVNQPGSPPAHINSGPPAIVRAAPVVYKLKPSIIYQQEVINKVPTPLSLNPVYVKVYKPGKQVDTSVRAPAYAPAAYSDSSYDAGSSVGSHVPSNEAAYGAPQYSSASQYDSQPAYGAQPAY